ncbi:MAG: S-layer homology domain-containing protein [Cyanobacteria bacterium J06635_1]
MQTTASVFYINPASGHDQNAGTAQAPFKTLTNALRQARPGTRLQLEAGVYQAETGERFPIKIPTGVTVSGQGGTVLITGGGAITTAEFGQQQVTLVLADRAQLRGVTVTNPLSQGIGVWIESGSPILARNRLVKCRRDGVYVTGNALPVILENEFVENVASGLFMVRQAKGEVRQNTFRKTGYGIALSDQAAPLLVANQVSENKAGIVISRSARPVLRQNRVEKNQTVGLWVQDAAAPDLGQSQDPGQNAFQNNAEWNLRNDVRGAVITAGNQLNPNTVRGPITYAASQLPDPVTIPEVLLGRVVPEPQPKATEPKAEPAPINLNSRFTDLVGHWAAPFVDALAENGLVRGFLDGSFRPDLTVTRAQFAALAMAAFPNQANDSRRFNAFVDVPNGFWAREVIYRAQAQGFLSGFPDNTFRPDAPMTRVQAIVALVSGLRLGAGQSGQLGVYQDRAQIPSYAIDAVAAATQRQMVVNHPVVDQLRPMQPITRAETVALVYQALVTLGKMPALPSPFIVRPLDVVPNFSDLERHWASPFIEKLSEKNLISGFGNGRFQPDNPMTRAQFAALVVNAYQPKLQRDALSFRDVPPDFWAAGAIQTAYRAKFLSGFPDYSFAPEHPVLKLQVLLALVSGLELNQKTNAPLSLLDRYRDRHRIPAYAEGAIATATQLGLVFNYPDKRELHPTRIANRAEVAAIVYQGLVILNKAEAMASPYQVTV